MMMTFSRFGRVLVIVALLGQMAFASLAFAETACVDPNRHLLSTTGQAELKAAPDSLQISATVEAEAPTLKQAQTEANNKMASMIKAIKALGIAGLQLKTQNFSVWPVQNDRKGNRLAQTIGYHVSNGLLISVVRQASETLSGNGTRLVDAITAEGATNVGGLSFFRDEMDSLRQKVLADAVRNARLNADTMAQASGVKIIDVYSLDGQPQYNVNTYNKYPMAMMSRAMADGVEATPATPVEAGEVTVSTTVSARYVFGLPQ